MTRFIIIKGDVENLKIMNGYQDFVLTQSTRNISGASVIAAALLSQSAAPITLSNSSSGVHKVHREFDEQDIAEAKVIYKGQGKPTKNNGKKEK